MANTIPMLLPHRRSEELILLGFASAPFPAVIARDGVDAIDLLIENPNRRLVLRSCWEAIELLDALRHCVLRRPPILIDGECARFPHPSIVHHPPIARHDLRVLQAVAP